MKAAKIYKVLHLMRPAFFPILDSRLARIYRVAALEAGVNLHACRPERPPSKYAYWAAVRQDLLDAKAPFEELRKLVARGPDFMAADVVTRLTDLRILDMIAWRDEDFAPR